MRARPLAPAPATVRAVSCFSGRGDPRCTAASPVADPGVIGLPRPSLNPSCDPNAKIQGVTPAQGGAEPTVGSAKAIINWMVSLVRLLVIRCNHAFHKHMLAAVPTTAPC